VSRFIGEVAVATGAGGGIGAASARRLASEGAAVALLDLTAPQHVAEEIGAPLRIGN
jgi:3-oxoacyl-[acyl-carrier protein] reductase